jgi:hypothetical protein
MASQNGGGKPSPDLPVTVDSNVQSITGKDSSTVFSPV